MTVLRVGHWQLEAGVRDAFGVLGAEFAKLPEVQREFGRVEIRQEAIPEDIYGQWLTSQMLGRTSPDLVEIGKLPEPVLLAFQSRYFLPLNDVAAAANPFNVGTALEGVPLKETFPDGMHAGYRDELQSFTKIPLSRFTARVFYNKSLLEKLTGLSEPPGELRAFLAVCRKIGAQRQASGQPYIPIASSAYHAAYWFANTTEPLTYPLVYGADYNRDGDVAEDETYVGIKTGKMSLNDRPWRARFALTRELVQQFQPGFIGLGRDEAVFLFAQQRAVFMCTGTWDVGSLVEQARGKFEVGIANFPQPAFEDAEYGHLEPGPRFDPAFAAFAFGLTNTSKHPELAKRFLQFLASKRGNAELNRIIGWIPAIADAPIPPELARFAPCDQGIYAAGNLVLGPDTLVAFNQYFSLYETDPGFSFERFVRDFTPVYLQRGQLDWEEYQREWRRAAVVNEEVLGAMRGAALLHNDAPDSAEWVAYRAFGMVRQLVPQLEYHEREEWLARPPAVGPYAYRAEALERARKNLAGAP